MMYVAIAHLVLLSSDHDHVEDAAQIAVLPLLNPKDYESFYCTYSFNHTDGVSHFLTLSAALPENSKRHLLTTLCKVLPALDDSTAGSIAGEFLTFAFPENKIPTGLVALTYEQRIVLKQIDRYKQIMHGDPAYKKIMTELAQNGVLAELGIKTRKHW